MSTTVTDPFAEMTIEQLLDVDTGTLSSDEQVQWEEAYKATPIGFVELVLGLDLYEWQDDALDPLDDLLDEKGNTRRIAVSVVAPNGSGKSERVVAGAGLYWLGLFPRGRVIVTSKDSKQINEQVWPALKKHERNPHFAGWHWVTSPYNKITTPTGGTLIAYTTNDEGRAEGAHMDFNPFSGNFDGPLLVIVDEAKSVDEGIFQALDRCGYNAIYYISSPGHRAGTFYESQTSQRQNYICVKAGLVDCPHIPQSKIDQIIAKYGRDDPYTRSTLFGEFMDATTRQRFDRAGLAHLEALSKQGSPKPADGRIDPIDGGNGKQVALVPCSHTDPSRWFRWWEPRIEGCRYLIVCDSASGAEQQKGSNNPDRHSVKVLRDAYIDKFGLPHKPAEVARIIPPCHFAIERLADYIACMSRFYGNCSVAVEANNTGLAVIVLLKTRGVPLFRRREGKPDNPIFKDGFYTHGFIRPLMISELADAIYQKAFDIWCPHTVTEFTTFVTKPDGSEAAEGAAHDDDVLASAIGKQCLPSGTIYRAMTRQTGDGISRSVGSAS